MTKGMKYLVVNEADFQKQVLHSDVPVLAYFWGKHCPPCRRIAPTIHQVAADYEGLAKVVKIDVDKNPKLVKSYAIHAIPSLLFFQNGEVVQWPEGEISDKELSALLDELILNYVGHSN